MRIESSHRVTYEHNPLAEVVCQVQFEKLADVTSPNRALLRKQFADLGYPQHAEEVAFRFSHRIEVGEGSAPVVSPIELPKVSVDHFTSSDGVWRISVSEDFLALTCLKYSGWDAYLPRMLEAASTVFSVQPSAVPSRLGLRYKDVIERERLGLEGTPWHDLIKPFLLGPLAPNALADGQTASEEDVGSFVSQALLRLDHAMVLVQSSLLASIDGQRRAFLIDADFYNEGALEPGLLGESSTLTTRLDGLHASAGALFRRGITEKLHYALRPSN